jgi:hypothetical protein
MLVCDSNCRILACDARFPGSVHDSAIFRTLDVRAFLSRQFENGDNVSHLIGDSGNGLEPWLFHFLYSSCRRNTTGSVQIFYSGVVEM